MAAYKGISFQILYLLLGLVICSIRSEINGKKYSNYFFNKQEPHEMTIHKVSLTQKGYIQFLKYLTDVPALTEFTFCIWVRSNNFTHDHPLLSYSLNEEQRFIRVWIGKYGREINMAILEQEIFKLPVNLHENHWHHICPSWNSKRAAWSLYVNGKQKDTGIVPKLRDVIIPPGGDIVVGQEYTDFNKGLDDGIEGDIYGFNLILSSTIPMKAAQHIDVGRRRQLYIPTTIRTTPPPPPFEFGATIPVYGYQVKEEELFNAENQLASTNIEQQTEAVVPQVLSYFKTPNNRQPKGIMDFGRSMLQNIYKYLEPSPRIRISSNEYHQQIQQKMKYPPLYVIKTIPRGSVRPQINTKRIFHNEIDNNVKSLGMLLVELSYNDCALGKGSPINDEKVLISWTKTPVRVFGGAILKTVVPFCRKY